ncbi:MAG: pantoate--beta-alanine ligase [Planctomycetota bacterium]
MQLLTKPAQLDAWKRDNPRRALVPTMGALHAGHTSLVRHAASTRLPTIVSIFVNPTQFNDPADFNRYPKSLDHDCALCEAAGAQAVWAPTVDDIYPPHTPIAVPPLPPVATLPGLEDAHRPGHFAGVLQVVKRLFDLVEPALAVFGEKDWQQLQLITQALGEGAGGPRILPSPTIREDAGLALSSRNRFLNVPDHSRALALSLALREGAHAASPAAAEDVMRDVLKEADVTPEYAVIRDASTLLAPRDGQPARALIAARIGAVRLIDNMPWPAPTT